MPHRGPKCHVTPHEETFAGSRGGPTQPTLVGSRGRNAAGAKPGPLSTMAWVGGSLKLRSVVEVGVGVQIQHVLLLSFRASSLSSDVQNHVHLHLVLTGLQSSNTS